MSVVCKWPIGKWLNNWLGSPQIHGWYTLHVSIYFYPSEYYKSLRSSVILFRQHHVESVHFGTSLGVAYHSAVASIQTPFHEYFVLRDNGLEIGCGEVSTLWMKILGCMADGVACWYWYNIVDTQKTNIHSLDNENSPNGPRMAGITLRRKVFQSLVEFLPKLLWAIFWIWRVVHSPQYKYFHGPTSLSPKKGREYWSWSPDKGERIG